jgi:hypothetical protein
MNKIIPTIFLSTVNAYSKCASSGLIFWPIEQTISQNSIFVIDGYATSQKIITDLGKTYKVFLKSEKHKILLNVQEILVGQYNLTQAILKPEKTLKAGQEYELVIENLEKEVYKYNSTTKEKEKIKWKVNKSIDTAPPIWIEKPKFENSSYQMVGCGPIAFANFTYSATDDYEYLIKTTLKNKSTVIETTYYLKTADQLIAVGHGMCSGEFNFYNGDMFEIEFSLIDASGTTQSGKAKELHLNDLNISTDTFALD